MRVLKISQLFFYLLMSVNYLSAQVGIGTNTPNASAVLDITSNNQGVLFPRITLVQRNNIVSPAIGLMIWCSNCGQNGQFQVYDGVSWTNLIGGTSLGSLSTISTSEIHTVESSTIQVAGSVVSNGGESLTEVGFCYSTTNSTPTKLNSPFQSGSVVSTNFTATISGLTPSTLYYIRAYGVNSAGTSYGSTIQATTSVAPASGFEGLLSQTLFNSIFPYRADKGLAQNGPEFYSYTGLNDAVNEVANIKLEILKRQNPDLSLINYCYKYKRTNLTTNQVSELVVGTDYNESWNTGKPEVVASTINFGDFVNSLDRTKDKKELVAFLANISHETTGGGDAEPTKTYGLYFKEEVGCPGGLNCATNYTSVNLTFPPVAGKTYHGRGPIQLSHNYNYGATSFILYGTINTLLNNPELVLANSKNAFMTAIVFWMLPQGTKPSCHNAIHETRGFAKTINIINGGLECGAANSSHDPQVTDRIGFYKKYSTNFGLTITETDVELSCRDINPY